jgi:hypothetical protein
VDRKRLDADPNPTFRFDADPNPDSNPDPTSSLTHGKSEFFPSLLFKFHSKLFYLFLSASRCYNFQYFRQYIEKDMDPDPAK